VNGDADGVDNPLLRACFDLVQDPLLLVEEGRVIDCNPAAASLFPAEDKDAVVGCSPGDLFGPGQPSEDSAHSYWRQQVERARREGWTTFGDCLGQGNGGELQVEVLLQYTPVAGRELVLATVREIFWDKFVHQSNPGTETFLQDILSVTNEGYVLAEYQDTQIVEVNEAMLHLLGYAWSEVRGTTIFDYVYPGYQELFAEKARQAEQTDLPVRSYEAVLQHKNGQPVPVQVNAGTMFSSDGEPAYNFAFITDLSEQKRVEEQNRQAREELAAKEAHFRAIINNASEGFVLHEYGDNRVKDVNDTLERMVGYPREQIIGRPIFEFVPEDVRHHLAYQAQQRPLNEHGHRQYELVIQHRQGHRTPVQVNATTFFDDNGQPTVAYGFLTDLTEQKGLEEALWSALNYFESILESSPVGVLFVDGERLIQHMNSEAERLLGYTGPELWGRSPRLLFYQEAELEAVDRKGYAAMAAGETYRQVVELERADGSVFPCALTGRPVNPDNSAEGYIWTLQDITEQVRLESELRRMATTDSLTGIPNRRHFLELAQAERQRALRHGHDLSLVMADVDSFKGINDTYGHGVGDEVLQALTVRIGDALREEELAGRLGGEEFAVLLPETAPEGALAAAERLRERVAREPVATAQGSLEVTVSIGVAEWREAEETVETLLIRADEALYAAKSQGRNRVKRG
jgi:diguanylate cyclase (GGDEF)-like protein/PAS domain S-box-containing protein